MNHANDLNQAALHALRTLLELQQETSAGISCGSDPEGEKDLRESEKDLRKRWAEAWTKARELVKEHEEETEAQAIGSKRKLTHLQRSRALSTWRVLTHFGRKVDLPPAEGLHGPVESTVPYVLLTREDVDQYAEFLSPNPDGQPPLTVQFLSMPESNGKRNWTVLLCRKDAEGLLGDIASGVCFGQSEYYDRMRYYADRLRFLIGERDTAPYILDYPDDTTEPPTYL